MQVRAMPNSLNLVAVASLVIKISRMQRLMHVSLEMNDVFQSLQASIIGCTGSQNFKLLRNRPDHAIAVRTVTTRIVGACVPGKVHVVSRACSWVAALVSPCRYRL